jgi:digeranylgeranylglycerophospholipid reductase
MALDKCDVIIIGAGPVGGYLAWLLSVQGLKVMVLEKKKEPGEKVCCTGIISRECYSQLALDSTVKSADLKAVNLVSPGGRRISFHRKSPIAHIVNRPALNRILANRASSFGALFLFDTRVTEIIPKHDCIEIEAASGKLNLLFRTKVLVIASGYGPGLADKISLGNIKDYVIGCQSEIELPGDNMDTDIYLDHVLAPGGFGWLVPVGKRKGLAGMVCRNKPRHHQQAFLEKLKANGKISQYDDKPGFGLIPVNTLKKTFNERLLVVGEAAGQVKPTTGGGIYYGIVAAYTAAETIKQAFSKSDFSARQMSLYQHNWHKTLGNEITLGRYLQKIFASLGNRAIDDLFNLAERSNLAGPDDGPELSFDWHSRAMSQLMHNMISFPKRK